MTQVGVKWFEQQQPAKRWLLLCIASMITGPFGIAAASPAAVGVQDSGTRQAGAPGQEEARPVGTHRGQVFIPDSPDGHLAPQQFLSQGPQPPLIKPISSDEWRRLGAIVRLSEDQTTVWMSAFPATVEAWNASLRSLGARLKSSQDAMAATLRQGFIAPADSAAIRSFFLSNSALATQYSSALEEALLSLEKTLAEAQADSLGRVFRLMRRRLQMTGLGSLPPGCGVDLEWELIVDPHGRWGLDAVERADISDLLEQYSAGLTSLLDAIEPGWGSFSSELFEIDIEMASLGRSVDPDKAHGLALRKAKFALCRKHRGPLIRIRDLGDVGVATVVGSGGVDLASRLAPWWDEVSYGVAVEGSPPSSEILERALLEIGADARGPLVERLSEDDRVHLRKMKDLYRAWVAETWVLNFAEYAAYKEYAKRMRTARLAWWTRRAELTSEVLALLDENGKTRAEAESPELLASLGTSRRQLVAACEQFREELERSDEVPASEWPAISR